MTRKVLLIGHCGPDSSYLRMAVRAAAPDALVVAIDNDEELDRTLGVGRQTSEEKCGVELALVNRSLDFGFNQTSGVELIRALKPAYPAVKFMLVSNYPDAQAAALKAGAIPGFGKRDIGSQVAKQALKSALA